MLCICCSGYLNGEQIHLLTVTLFLYLGGKIEKEDLCLGLPSCTSTVGSRWGERAGNTGKTTKVREWSCARMEEEKEYVAGNELSRKRLLWARWCGWHENRHGMSAALQWDAEGKSSTLDTNKGIFKTLQQWSNNKYYIVVNITLWPL